MQTVALLLVSTGVVDGVNIHIVGKNTCACPVVSFKHDGVVLVAIDDVAVTLLQGIILRTTSPGVGQTLVGLIISTNPLGDSTRAVVTSCSTAVGCQTRLRETVALQTELHGVGAVARNHEDGLRVVGLVFSEVGLICGCQTVFARGDDALHLCQTLFVALVARGAQIHVLVEIELGKCHRAGILVAVAVEVVVTEVLLGGGELLHEEIEHLLGTHLLGQITRLHVLGGLQGDIAEHVEHMIVEHGTEEAGVCQTGLRCGILRVDGIDHLVGITNAAVGNLPRVIHLVDVGTPIVLVQVDVGVAPAHTHAGRHHILVGTLLEGVIHAKPVFYQIAILCCGSTEQQTQVGLVGEVDVGLVEAVI